LDFFVWPPFRGRPEEPRLPRSEWEYLAWEDEVRSFLEKQCHLSRRTPVPGNEAEQHCDAFNVWGRWVENGTIIAPFCVVHVDAHSDLGSGWNNRSFTFIETELLALPIEQRRHPVFGPEHLNAGNYLLGAIANRWISRLTYVYPVDRTERFEDEVREMTRLLWADQAPPVNDLPAWIFRNDDWKTGIIELKHRLVRDGLLKDGEPVSSEPLVPFEWKEEREFSLDGVTHMFLAQSPEHTPIEADELLPIVRKYFYSV
jgi:hypothetical protein